MKKFTSKVREEVLENHKNGLSNFEIVAKNQIAKSSVRNILKEKIF